MMRTLQTVDSSPIEKPDRIVVAGPVWVDSAISCTGLNFVREVLGEDLDDAREDQAGSTATAGRRSSM